MAPRKHALSDAAGSPPSMVTPPIIATGADIRAGVKALRQACVFLRQVHDAVGDPPLRRSPGGFPGLARIVVGQQVSVASATAIWARFSAVADPMTAATVAGLSDEAFRTGGLSRPKIRTLRALAGAVATGLDLDGLAGLEPAAARQALTAISGIGPWTADVYLMFCVGHRDVFAPGDLALQIAAARALGLDARPSADRLAAIAEARWQPWRGVAARLLWHYYAHIKTQDTAQPL